MFEKKIEKMEEDIKKFKFDIQQKDAEILKNREIIDDLKKKIEVSSKNLRKAEETNKVSKARMEEVLEKMKEEKMKNLALEATVRYLT